MFENEAFASQSRHEGVAISALIAGIEEDSKSDVSLPLFDEWFFPPLSFGRVHFHF